MLYMHIPLSLTFRQWFSISVVAYPGSQSVLKPQLRRQMLLHLPPHLLHTNSSCSSASCAAITSYECDIVDGLFRGETEFLRVGWCPFVCQMQ